MIFRTIVMCLCLCLTAVGWLGYMFLQGELWLTAIQICVALAGIGALVIAFLQAQKIADLSVQQFPKSTTDDTHKE